MQLMHRENRIRELAASASQNPSPFADVAHSRLGEVATGLNVYGRMVKDGDLTVKQARERLRSSLDHQRGKLTAEAQAFSRIPANLRLILDDAQRKRREAEQVPDTFGARALQSLGKAQLEELRRLRVQTEIQNRRAEFENAGRLGGESVTPGSMIAYYQSARTAGDEAAAEYARQSLAVMRTIVDAENVAMIDDAITPRDSVNERIVDRVLTYLERASEPVREAFVARAIESGNASELTAAFLAVRAMTTAEPDGTYTAWMNRVLAAASDFPPSVIDALDQNDRAIRQADAQTAILHVDHLSESLAYQIDANFPDPAVMAGSPAPQAGAILSS